MMEGSVLIHFCGCDALSKDVVAVYFEAVVYGICGIDIGEVLYRNILRGQFVLDAPSL